MVTLIHGSHRNGICYQALLYLEKLLKINNIEVNILNLKDLCINFCCGEQLCQKSGICKYNDIMVEEIVPLLQKTNFIYIFTPTYFNMPPAILKNFIDRCNYFLLNLPLDHDVFFGTWISGETDINSCCSNIKVLKEFSEICGFKMLDNCNIIKLVNDSKSLNEIDLLKLKILSEEIYNKMIKMR
jgi:multimeric flavodoxin WrbA